MRKKVSVLLLLVLIATLWGCRSDTVWETVDDGVLYASAPIEEPYIITYGIPNDASMDPLSVRNRSLYVGKDGEYEILSDVITAANLDEALRQVSGFGEDELDVLETTRFGLPEYRFAWASSSDEGELVSQASLVEDGGYYYALVFTVRQGLGSKYDDCAEAVFASFGLNVDESF